MMKIRPDFSEKLRDAEHTLYAQLDAAIIIPKTKIYTPKRINKNVNVSGSTIAHVNVISADFKLV